MARASTALLSLGLLAACGGPGVAVRPARLHPPSPDLPARLAARAASFAGHGGAFHVAGERFNADCTGFVQAVHEIEGIPLRALMRETAPRERSGGVAAYRTVQRFGWAFGGGGEWPAPGDLVFWHDTYDRNRNGKRDDPFTHVGIVEYVSGGTVVFLHFGSSGVVRGAMTLHRPEERAADGYVLNSPLRSKGRSVGGAPVLASALFAAYGRLDAARLPAPRELALVAPRGAAR